MDYRIDDEAAALRAALLEFLRERMPDPGTEPGDAARRIAAARLQRLEERVRDAMLVRAGRAGGGDSFLLPLDHFSMLISACTA